MKKDYYQVLDVAKDASPDEIQSQFRFMSHVWHPDKFPVQKQKVRATEKFKEINEAYGVLSNPRKRKHHDWELKKAAASSRATGTPASAPPPPPTPPPKPEASTKTLNFGAVDLGEERSKSFKIHNRGGPFKQMQLVAQEDDWFSSTNLGNKKFPIKVEVTADTRSLEWGLKYVGWIEIHLDDVFVVVNIVITIKEEPVPPEIVVQWDPPEAANADFFFDLEPGEKRQAQLLVEPKFKKSGLFRVLVAEPLPDWLHITPMSFTPPATLTVEFDPTEMDLETGETWEDKFDLEFILDD